jgi:predicted dehydrogenase
MAAGAGYLQAGLEDVAFVTLDFGDNLLAQVYVSWYALEKARQITAVGSQAILVCNDLCQDRLVSYARRYEQSQEHDPQGRPRWHWKDEGKQPISLPKTEPLRAECQHFVECIITGDHPLTDGQAGLEAVRVLEACQKSLEHNNIWMEVTRE